jgi:hypothetical protein
MREKERGKFPLLSLGQNQREKRERKRNRGRGEKRGGIAICMCQSVTKCMSTCGEKLGEKN